MNGIKEGDIITTDELSKLGFIKVKELYGSPIYTKNNIYYLFVVQKDGTLKLAMTKNTKF